MRFDEVKIDILNLRAALPLKKALKAVVDAENYPKQRAWSGLKQQCPSECVNVTQ